MTEPTTPQQETSSPDVSWFRTNLLRASIISASVLAATTITSALISRLDTVALGTPLALTILNQGSSLALIALYIYGLVVMHKEIATGAPSAVEATRAVLVSIISYLMSTVVGSVAILGVSFIPNTGDINHDQYSGLFNTFAGFFIIPILIAGLVIQGGIAFGIYAIVRNSATKKRIAALENPQQ
jgi:hypothetical protein